MAKIWHLVEFSNLTSLLYFRNPYFGKTKLIRHFGSWNKLNFMHVLEMSISLSNLCPTTTLQTGPQSVTTSISHHKPQFTAKPPNPAWDHQYNLLPTTTLPSKSVEQAEVDCQPFKVQNLCNQQQTIILSTQVTRASLARLVAASSSDGLWTL